MSTQMLGQAFRSALHDDRVSAIVFDVDSPGGTVAGTGELASEILQSRGAKPIVSVINSMGASGALWIASMADEVVITPGGEAGSVGVYRIHEDFTKALEQDGIKPTIVRSSQSPFKIEGSGLEPLTPGAQDHMQQSVDQAAEVFIRSLADARRKTLTHVRENFGQGRMLSATQAVSVGMADRVDTLEHTLERFGSGTFNAIANAARAKSEAREAAGTRLATAFSAPKADGIEPLTIEEIEEGLASTYGLTNKQSKRAVALLRAAVQRDAGSAGTAQRDAGDLTAQRDAGGPTEPAKSADVSEIRRGFDDLRSTLERLHAAAR
jgi:signal peptide peptidase SppA